MALASNQVQLVEVSPRDGLQNEARTLLPSVRAELIKRIAADGAQRIEAVSFAHPGRVPQMAGAEEVLREATEHAGPTLTALVLNHRGFERAVAASVREINVVVLATDTFSQRNQGMSRAKAISSCSEIIVEARRLGIRTTATVGAAFGCPFEGDVSLSVTMSVIEATLDAGVDEICVADTIGVGVPRQVLALAKAMSNGAPDVPLRGHFHDTRNTGIANLLTAAESGFSALDVSVGGIGGCPFAPAATGNVATEHAIYALERSGFTTNRDVDIALATGQWIREKLGIAVGSCAV